MHKNTYVTPRIYYLILLFYYNFNILSTYYHSWSVAVINPKCEISVFNFGSNIDPNNEQKQLKCKYLCYFHLMWLYV